MEWIRCFIVQYTQDLIVIFAVEFRLLLLLQSIAEIMKKTIVPVLDHEDEPSMLEKEKLRWITQGRTSS
jgi:hypothetical protein